ncbi:MAG: S-methyl-5'-thioadenosine phosphorylase, partial [Acidimicrobiales bacterium]
MATPSIDIGVIGGSGFYRYLADMEPVEVSTPYGPPSAPPQVGTLGGISLGFIPRHGTGHTYPPHRVPYRANMWALHSLGATRVFGPSAGGSLRTDIQPGHIVVCDQLINRTHGRGDTFHDGPEVAHLAFADPYCPELRAAVISAGETWADQADGVESDLHPRGTVVVVEGPRFSTRAESSWHRSMGAEVVTMTQYPEPALARELGMCYSGLCLVTDYDTGLEGDVSSTAVTARSVLETLDQVVNRAQELIAGAIDS